MSKKFKQLIMKLTMLGMSFYIIFQSVIPSLHKKYESKQEEKYIEQIVEQKNIKLNKRAEVDMAKNIVQYKLNNAKAMVNNINTDAELILATVTGTKNISYTEGKGNKFFDSSIEFELDYKAIVSIPLSTVSFEADAKGTVYVSYMTDDIKCNTVEISKYTPIENKAPLDLINRGISDEQKYALIELATEQIKSDVMARSDILKQSRKTIETTFASIANKFKVSDVCINGTVSRVSPNIYNASELINGIPVNRYYVEDNLPGEKLQDVKAIVVHSTANLNNGGVGVQGHYKWLQHDKNGYSTSFYVDHQEVGVMVDEGMAGYGVKTNKGYDNFNTISIEICENIDDTLQQKSIENAAIVVAELQKMYPNAEIIPHNDIATDGRLCPRIFKDNTHIKMEWNEFLNIVNDIQ